ncbi:MAG: amino acid racemase [Desulfurococcales archaeon]|nr:amino acid racemase [Desulfurococcales archaeon]
MKEPIGIVGGLSPYSTILYYKFIVEYFRDKVGRDPRIILYSIPVQEMCKHVEKGDKKEAVGLLVEAFRGLEDAGAKIGLLAANTPHMFLKEALGEAKPSYPVVDIREAVARRIERMRVSKVGLLATRATVESRIYHEYLEPLGVEVVTPGLYGQKIVDSIVDRLVEGRIPESLNLKLAQVISSLKARGVEALVYGCTELSLLVGKIKLSILIIDSLTEHVKLVVDRALEK